MAKHHPPKSLIPATDQLNFFKYPAVSEFMSQKLEYIIESGRINTVIIYKIDRLTRSLKDFSMRWDTFQKKGVQLISLNEKFDTSLAIGRPMLSIILIFAQLEREQTGERTSVTMPYRAE